MTNIAQNYIDQINPIKIENKWTQSRADKETRYAHYYAAKTANLAEKERWSIDLLKLALAKSKNPAVSCSFGIDSMLDIYLTRKALEELGRDPSDIDIVWNDTANEFPEVRKFQRHITKLWNLRLIVTKPKRTLKLIIKDHGGITDDYFTLRKSSRATGGKPLSEKCCNTLKHLPMKQAMRNGKYDLIIVGLRADESRQRLQAALRDGEYFYSVKEWKSFVCRPIQWWRECDVWEYVEQKNIPYNDLYRKNLIQEYPNNAGELALGNRKLLQSVGLDVNALYNHQVQLVDRRQADTLEQLGFKIFKPRTGCMMCPIPIKYGYLHWMRINHDKVYNAMIHNLGYGEALVNILPDPVKEELQFFLGVELTPENIHEHLIDMLQVKPCTFDRF